MIKAPVKGQDILPASEQSVLEIHVLEAGSFTLRVSVKDLSNSDKCLIVMLENWFRATQQLRSCGGVQGRTPG